MIAGRYEEGIVKIAKKKKMKEEKEIKAGKEAKLVKKNIEKG